MKGAVASLTLYITKESDPSGIAVKVVAAGAIATDFVGGSLRDDEVIRRADELGLAMVFTGERHFLH